MEDHFFSEISGSRIEFRRSIRAKSMIITVKSEGRVIVSMPGGISAGKAVEFAESKSGWIHKQLDRLRAMKARQKNSSVGMELGLSPGKAREKVISRLTELSGAHELPFNRVFIRKQKTRWGSCSSKNNINLNISLAYLPGDLMDYVILHELVHTKIKNHGRGFWMELDRHVGNGKALKRKLKEYSPDFFNR